MKLKIKITKEIIKQALMCGTEGIKGISEVTSSCAIALAVREIFPNCAVQHAIIRPYGWGINEERDNIKLPTEATLFILKFDSLHDNYKERLNLPELEFQIELPHSLLDYISIEEIKESLKTSTNLELV